MEALSEHLDRLVRDAASAVRDAFDDGLTAVSDDGVLEVLAASARLGRLADALLVEATGVLAHRDACRERDARVATRRGCRDTNELLRRATLCTSRRAAELARVADGVRRRAAISTGEVLPARYPQLRIALTEGAVSAEALGGVFAALEGALPAATVTQRLAADEELAGAATGTGPDGQPPASADELRLQAHVWAMVLDPDGAEPRDERAVRCRELRLGRCRDGLVPIRGTLLVDVAAQLQTLFDAHENPKRRGPVFTEPASADDDEPDPAYADRRTAPQRHHDAFAAILSAAAGAADTPTLGGAAPTLTVTVRAEDLCTGRGYGHLDGIGEPVSVSLARHTACVGRIEQVTVDAVGRVLGIRVQERIFTAAQRRAIAARDGGCVIPGCTARSSWCEIHHVAEWADGGSTTTDNGVALCWFHHRTLDTSGWEVRMTQGIPEIRGPAWWDRHRRWRPANKHPLWMRDRAVASAG